MIRTALLCAGLALGLPSAATAATVIPAATLSIFINADLSKCDGSVRPDASGGGFCDGSVRPAETLRFPVLSDGSFSGRHELLVLGDGSVVPADGRTTPVEARISLDLSGSIFPFQNVSVGIFDDADPTTFVFVFNSVIPALTGMTSFDYLDDLVVPGGTSLTAGLPGGTFFRHLASGTEVAAAGTGSVFAPGQAWSGAGLFDCAAGCTTMSTEIGFAGVGKGTLYEAHGHFNMDPVSAVPLPAAGWMLAAGLGMLAIGRRRRAA